MSLLGAELGVILGGLAFVVVYITAVSMTHSMGAGFCPALVAAMWAARPFFHRYSIAHHHLLHPVPRQYNFNCRQVMESINNVLKETRYNYGHDRWQIEADVESNEIRAKLNYRDEGGGQRPKRERRHIKFEVELTPEGNTTIARFRFEKEAEGAIFDSWCYPIIGGIMNEIEAAIGPSKNLEEPLSVALPPAPAWLKTLTIVVVVLLFFDTGKAMLGSIFKNNTAPVQSRELSPEKKQEHKDFWQWLNDAVVP